MSEFNWTCPYCQRAQVVAESKHSFPSDKFRIGDNRFGSYGYQIYAIACANRDCLEVSVSVTLGSGEWNNHGRFVLGEEYTIHRLRPESHAKLFPSYVPTALVTDYVEACRIRDLSPKASATLSRRCIQGVIRDFCKISKSRLIDEINTLRTDVDNGRAPSGVTVESVEAIDHVRQIGNIGAHMEKDINIIVDVDPGEAQALIELIELLFEEWYVARNARQLKLEKVRLIAADKAMQKTEPTK
jgi:Domain of unknown function (DUF4145)